MALLFHESDASMRMISWLYYENGCISLWVYGFRRMVSLLCGLIFDSVTVMRIDLLLLVHQSYINNLGFMRIVL